MLSQRSRLISNKALLAVSLCASVSLSACQGSPFAMAGDAPVLQARAVQPTDRKPLNLVLVIDRSGSMAGNHGLKNVQKALPGFIDGLGPQDRISLVTYDTGVQVPVRNSSNPGEILNQVQALTSGGNTAGGAALWTAHDLANGLFDPQHDNRILLVTDGRFSMGASDPTRLQQMIEKDRAKGITLSILDVGKKDTGTASLASLAHLGGGDFAKAASLGELRADLAAAQWKSLLQIAATGGL